MQLVRFVVPAFCLIAVLGAVDNHAADHAPPFPPDQSNLPVKPPDGAIVLFDGKTNRFRGKTGSEIDWPIEDDSLVSTRGGGRSNHLVSTVHFRDADIHVEFMIPKSGKGNSGIYVHGNYEFQIIHSFGKSNPGREDLGAVYGFSNPLVNAARDRGAWQVVDIRYRAPRRDDAGKIIDEGSITAWLNGRQVQNNVRLGEPRSNYHPFRYRTTPYLDAIGRQQLKTSVGPVFLQDHDSPVRFRNVWIRPLDELAHEYQPPQDAGEK